MRLIKGQLLDAAVAALTQIVYIVLIRPYGTRYTFWIKHLCFSRLSAWTQYGPHAYLGECCTDPDKGTSISQQPIFWTLVCR